MLAHGVKGPVRVHIRRCEPQDWGDIRRLHVKLALAFPAVVDVELNQVFSMPDDFWENFVRMCAHAEDQALFVAEDDAGLVAMGHVDVQGELARLDLVYVEGECRRRGVGTALIDALVRWAASAGATRSVGYIAQTSDGSKLAAALGWDPSDDVTYTKGGLEEHKWTAPPLLDRP